MSTTSDIIELQVPIPVPSLGIANSQLRIIDTPGIGDTRGMGFNARFMGSLDEYLSKHEDLKRYLPNLILFFVRFDENRFGGKSSAFVKALKALEPLKHRLIDRSYSNVVFVLTHFLSESKPLQRYPLPKITQFRFTVQEFSTLPGPHVFVVADNKADEAGMLELNGYWALPNDELYPKNLFDRMQDTLGRTNDPVGKAVVTECFANGERDFNISNKVFRLLPLGHSRVTRYFNVLSSIEVPVDMDIGIQDPLSRAWEKMPQDVKAEFPAALDGLKKALSNRNMQTPGQLPQRRDEVFHFLREMNPSPVTIFLLEQGLNMTIPHLVSLPLLLGSGYDLRHDTSRSTLFTEIDNQEGYVYSQDIGLKVPPSISITPSHSFASIFTIHDSKSSYTHARLGNLGLRESEMEPSSFHLNVFNNAPGQNLCMEEETVVQLTAVLEYHLFSAQLRNVTLPPEIVAEVRALSSLNSSSYSSISEWKRFFDLYGSHFVTQAFGGGSIEVTVYKEMSNFQDEGNRTQLEVTEGEEEEYVDDDDGREPSNSSSNLILLTQGMSQVMSHIAETFQGREIPLQMPNGVKYTIHYKGGSNNVGSQTAQTETLEKWKASVSANPVMLSSFMTLLPMSQVGNWNFSERAKVEEATRTYLNSSLAYVLPESRGHDGIQDRDSVGREVGGSIYGGFAEMKEMIALLSGMAEEGAKAQGEMIMRIAEMHQKQREGDDSFFTHQQQLFNLQSARRKEEYEREKGDAEDEFRRREFEGQQELARQTLEMETASRARESRRLHEQEILRMQAQGQSDLLQLLALKSQRNHELQLAEMKQPRWWEGMLGMVQRQGVQVAAMLPALLAAAG